MERRGGIWPAVIGSALVLSSVVAPAAAAPPPAPEAAAAPETPPKPKTSATGAGKASNAPTDPKKTAPQAAPAAPQQDAGIQPEQPVDGPRIVDPATQAEMEEITGQPGSSGDMNWMQIGVLFCLVVAGAAVVLGAIALLRRKARPSEKDEEPTMGYDNMLPGRRRGLHDDPRDREIEQLKERLILLEQRVATLERRDKAAGAPPPADDPYGQPPQSYRRPSDNPPGQVGGVYNRKSDRQELPEDNWPPARRAPSPNQYAPPPPAPQSERASLQRLSDQLSDLFNRANKSDFDALAAEFNAESYTNDRRGDLSVLTKDESDRFWVVPVPGTPDLALMIPGFIVKKSWLKLRQAETDHPLAHHFELCRGDRLQVIKPAVLRRNSNNFWELKEKGVVEGIS